MGVLTPGSNRSFPHGAQERRLTPPATGEGFQRLFPSSPLPGESSTVPVAPPRRVIEIEDTPIPDTTGDASPEGGSPRISPVRHALTFMQNPLNSWTRLMPRWKM